MAVAPQQFQNPPPKPRTGAAALGLLYAASLALIVAGLWRVSRDWSPPPDLTRLEGLAARGDRDAAEQGYREILDRSPRHGDARRALARLLAQAGDMRGCADQLHAIPEWWPGKRADQFLEGQAYLGPNLAQPAEAAWLGAVADDPLHPLSADLLNGAGRALVALYVLQERIPEAHAVLQDVSKQSAPEDQPGILATRMQAEIDRIEPREAAAILGRYVEADPSDRHSRRALARVLNSLQEYDEADRVLAVALAEQPDDPQALTLRIQLLDERGDFAALERAVAEFPASADGEPNTVLLQARGMIAESRGDLDAAEIAFRAAAARDPHDPQAQFRLARVLRRREKIEEADQALRRSQDLKTARLGINEALTKLAAANRPGGPDKISSYNELSKICETLGWTDLAGAWRSLTP